MATKRSVKNQKYETYWKLTLEYSDIFGEPFNNVLQIMVDFIDTYKLYENELTKELYSMLQEKVYHVYPKVDKGSTRKSLNQFVKLGFIEPKLKLIKTLAYSGPLNEEDLCALISLKDISNIKKGFLTREELETQKRFVSTTGFNDRKYNQKSYLYGIAKRLTGVFCGNGILSLDSDNLPDTEELKSRDPYLHSLYKKALKDESKKIFGKIVCDFEQIEYTSYVASHIKPFHESSPEEQYNVNNGFLFSRNIDILFDKFDLTFDINGNPIWGRRVSKEFQERYKNHKIDKRLLNPERLEFLKIHNSKFYEKNKS